MQFDKLPFAGAYLVQPEPIHDARGSFSRFYCEDEFAGLGLKDRMVQGSLSSTAKAGTIRGMHYQIPPAGEAKFIRVLRGAVYDVIIDLRPQSETFLQHVGVEMSADSRVGIYVPPYFAHGHQALTDDVEITYLVSERFTPGAERGIRFDDPKFAIEWPLPVTKLSDKDAEWPAFDVELVTRELTVSPQ